MEMPYDGESERLVGVMGLQQLEDLTLIRLANVRMGPESRSAVWLSLNVLET
jgi:hypothetical protein